MLNTLAFYRELSKLSSLKRKRRKKTVYGRKDSSIGIGGTTKDSVKLLSFQLQMITPLYLNMWKQSPKRKLRDMP